MKAAREWMKANGGFPAVVVVGLGLFFAFWPLGIAFIVVGVLGWLITWSRFPFTVIHKRESFTTDSRKRLLWLAQVVKTELETCRSRLAEAESTRLAWLPPQQLPAAAYNEHWTRSELTADEVAINDGLRGFYVWADQMNWKFAARVNEEETSIGWEFTGRGRQLVDADLGELDEGLSRYQDAQDLLSALIERLTAPPDSLPAALAIAIAGAVAGVVVGVSIGYTVFSWKPWASDQGNRFVGMTCYEREQEIRHIEETGRTFVTDEARKELSKAGKIAPCKEP